MAFIILIFAKMHSVSYNYGQGVMKYKSNCLGVGASQTITKEKNMLKIRRLPHIQNAIGNIDLGNKKSCLQDFGLSSKR